MADFLSLILPGYFGPHEKTVRRSLERLYTNKVIELQKQLQNVQWVSITTDLWRRPKKHHYLCVTVHFLDQDHKYNSKVLSFQRFHGRHFAKRIRAHLTRVVNRFGLQSKIVATVTDNGSDVRSATQLQSVFGIRLHCVAHGLNLTVKKGLGLWTSKKQKQKETTYSRSLNSLGDDADDTEEEDNGEGEQNIFDDDDDDEIEEAMEKHKTTTTSTPNNSANSNLHIQDTDSDNEDLCEAPRDETEVVSSDEEMDEGSEAPSNQSFNIEIIDQILTKCRKLVGIVNRSSILYEILHNLARLTVKVDLVVDMMIRWNSTHKMISHLLTYKSILPIFYGNLSQNNDVSTKKQKQLINFQLSDDEWEILTILSECLSYFAEATEMLSSSSFPSFGITYSVLGSLQHYLNGNSSSGLEMAMKNSLKEKFEYYMNHPVNSEEHKVLLACAYLDPTAHQLMTDQDKQSAKHFLGLELKKMGHFDTNSTAHSSSSITSESSTQSVALPAATKTSAVERLKLFRKKCGIIDDPMDTVVHKDLTLRQEFANFEAYKKDDLSFTAFWQKYANSLPKLNAMALRYGTIPGTSVHSESLFSIAGYMARKT